MFVSTSRRAVESLSAAQARRVALAAQGFGSARPSAVGSRQLRGLLGRLGQVQIDSVNVFERAHYLPAFSRLGRYATADFDALAGRHAIEYWPHQAGIIPAEDWPLWAWRREAFSTNRALHWFDAHDDLVEWILAELASRGPLSSGQLDHDRNRSTGSWWGWSDVKRTLEYLWRTGEVVCLRRRNFERLYELPAALPAAAKADPLPQDEALLVLVERAARALGVFTEADLADYWRLSTAMTRPLIRQLVETGTLLPVRVQGWVYANGTPIAAWMHVEARIPRQLDTATVLSPFDPVVWFRPRAERLFNFSYRIEIYTPAAKRVFGYYSLPVLLGDRLVGRVDLKADRPRNALLLQSAWAEEDAPAELAERLPAVLVEAARWQGLSRIENAGRGNLASAIAAGIEC